MRTLQNEHWHKMHLNTQTTMSPRDLVYKTLNFESPERVPRQMWLLPWALKNFPVWSNKILNAYPDDLVHCPAFYERPLKLTGGKYTKGLYIDEWGCRFHIAEEGLMGIVSEPRIAEWTDLQDLIPPEEMLHPDKDEINRYCKATDKFVYSNCIIRPFERFQFLRTMEQSFIDVMFEEQGYLDLLKILHEHFCKEVEVWCKTDIDAIFLMDDWGTQDALMVPPAVFTTHFKPMYKDYCEIAHHYGKKVFMHSDGYITDIIDDLIEVGVDAINSQVFCMNMQELSERFKGRITFWGEIDRQSLLPNASVEEIDEAVIDMHKHLYDHGGVIAQCEFGPGAKPENVMQVFESWNNI